jgi:hypothetical protein
MVGKIILMIISLSVPPLGWGLGAWYFSEGRKKGSGVF